MKKYLLIVSLFINNVTASIPTIESLFRNGNNSDVTSNTVAISVKIQEIFENNLQEKSFSQKSQDTTGLEVTDNLGTTKELKKDPLYFKLIFFNENKDKIQLLQLSFKESLMSEKSLFKIFHQKNFLQFLKSNPKIDINKEIFYSAFFILGLNKSISMATFLKRTNDGYVSNKEIINHEKFKILEEYKNYLLKIKANPTLKDTLESPIRPNNIEERQRVKKKLVENLFNNSQKIKLIKEDDKLYWNINLKKFSANFSNEEHQLVNILFNETSNNFKMNFYDYLLFNGIHEFPKNIVVQTTDGRIYSIQVIDLKHSTSTINNFENLSINYKNQDNINKTQNSSDIDFLY